MPQCFDNPRWQAKTTHPLPHHCEPTKTPHKPTSGHYAHALIALCFACGQREYMSTLDMVAIVVYSDCTLNGVRSLTSDDRGEIALCCLYKERLSHE